MENNINIEQHQLNLQRYQTVVSHKWDTFRNAVKQSAKSVILWTVFLTVLSYWINIQFGSTILWLLGSATFGFWGYYVWRFQTYPTFDNARTVFAMSISVITFIVTTLLPIANKAELPNVSIAFTSPTSKDSTMMVVSTTGVSKIVPEAKKIVVSANFGNNSVNASPEANELKYEKAGPSGVTELLPVKKVALKATGTATTATALQLKEARCWEYVKRFLPIAKIEKEKFNIPISITLAQGLLESDAGSSFLALKANNHFGIKTWNKNVPHVIAKDDGPKDKFKKYDSAWESFRDHSLFLMKNNYKELHLLSKTDYKGWAKGLEKAEYATDKQYAENLIKIIERMKLYKYDQA
jgi:flagellum-specific peptidoglycan hydrolase FlgJ